MRIRRSQEEPPALKTCCCLCAQEIETTTGAVLIGDDSQEEPFGVAHGRCWRSLRAHRRWSLLTGWLLVAHAVLALASLWALGAGRYGLAVALTAAAGVSIFAAWEIEGCPETPAEKRHRRRTRKEA